VPGLKIWFRFNSLEWQFRSVSESRPIQAMKGVGSKKSSVGFSEDGISVLKKVRQ
jgi:hypothetical protein